MPGNDGFTTLLLHCDGTNGSTTFTNVAASSLTPAPVTAGGTAQLSIVHKEFGITSGLFDGTSNTGLTLTGTAFGTSDFTIDLWIRPTVFTLSPSNNTIFDGRGLAGTELAPALFLFSTTGTTATVNYYDSFGTQITGTTALSLNTWYHVALTRSGTSTRLFLNGAQEGSIFVDTNNYTFGVSRPIIGAGFIPTTTVNYIGFLDEIRISNGVARWTSNFTVLTQPYDTYSGFGIPRWSEPVRFRRLAAAQQQSLISYWPNLPNPNVRATMAAISGAGINTPMFGVMVTDEEPVVPQDLTSVNVTIDEVDGSEVSASIRDDR